MPELPEVETIRRQLARVLVGKRLTHIIVTLPRMIRGRFSLLRKHTVGARVIGIDRRGKFLLWHFSSGWTIVIHLKMTGQLIYRRGSTMYVGGHPIAGGTDHLPNKYTHVIFSFPAGARVYFNDLRQFGFVELVRTSTLNDYFRERRMGPEPLQRRFTLDYFLSLIARRPQTTIKQLLMDQTAIAGIGNIYAVESLWTARIRPTRRVRTITTAEAKRLYAAIKKILQAAVRAQGSSADNYVDAYGKPGRYVPRLKVYGREGKRCPRCGATIKKYPSAVEGRRTVRSANAKR